MLGTTVLILLLAPSVALGVIWTLGIVRERRAGRAVPSVRAGVALAERGAALGPITAIVPAHNEQGSIGPVIASLRAQRGVDLRVVVALDRCTDGTLDAAREAIGGDPRFTVMEIQACPDGWPGKVNACWQAAQSGPAREAELLLFLDADVTLEPDCVRSAAALGRERGLEMVTLLSTLRHEHWFEKLVQPACVMELAYEFPRHKANSPAAGAGDRRPARPFVNGQFVLVGRGAYDRIGGHAALAGDIMEDFALARVAADAGLSMGAFPADGMLVAGMYDSWDAFVRGWMRIFLAGSGRKVRRLRKWSWRLWVACTALPVVVMAALALSAMGLGAAAWARWISGGAAGVALAIWLGFLVWAYWRQRAPLWSVLVHPWAIGMAAWIQRRAARTLASREPIAWAGKSYVFEPR